MLSPDKYIELMEEIENALDYAMAIERIESDSKIYSLDDIKDEFDVTEKDLDEVEDDEVDFV